MKKLSAWVKIRYPILLEILLIFLCGCFIIYCDRFQEKISPRKYWLNKVKELEGGLKADLWKVRFLEISLQKEKALNKYAIQAAIDHAKSFGEDMKSVMQSIENEQKDRLYCLEKNLKVSKKELQVCHVKLNEAKSKLHKLKG